jgi:hypothetical protein
MLDSIDETVMSEEENEVNIYAHAEHWADIFDGEFKKESDRASVILAASIFDNVLTELLKNHFVSNAASSDDLFDGANAPLSTFSAKITISHRLGLISSTFARDLHLIRRIRNEFAHNVQGCSFEDTRVKSRTVELYKSTDYALKSEHRKDYPEGPRGDFMLVCSWMLWSLSADVQRCPNLQNAELEFGYDYKTDSEEESNK